MYQLIVLLFAVFIFVPVFFIGLSHIIVQFEEKRIAKMKLKKY